MAKVIERIQRASPIDNVRAFSAQPDSPKEMAATDINQIRREMQSKLQAEFESKHALELKQRTEEAYRQGLEEGKRYQADAVTNAHNRQTQAYQKASSLLSSALDAIEVEKKLLVTRTKQDLIEIIFDTVCQIISQEFLPNEKRVSVLLDRLLSEYQDQPSMEIKLSPNDLALLDAIQADEQPVPNVRFSACHTVEDGGAIIHSRQGQLDLRLSTKLEQFKQMLQTHGEAK